MVRAYAREPFVRVTLVIALIVALAFTSLSVFTASSQVAEDETFYACLYAGSLSQVNNTAPPENCGRGVNVQWDGAEQVDLTANAATTERFGTTVAVAGLGSNTATADCEVGEVATGGGHVVTAVTGNGAYIDTSRAISDLDDVAVGWTVTATGTSQFNNVNLTAYVICLAVDLEAVPEVDPA